MQKNCRMFQTKITKKQKTHLFKCGQECLIRKRVQRVSYTLILMGCNSKTILLESLCEFYIFAPGYRHTKKIIWNRIYRHENNTTCFIIFFYSNAENLKFCIIKINYKGQKLNIKAHKFHKNCKLKFYAAH